MLDAHDPRLTAYVLGELNETDRAALEAELDRSPALRATVEQLRQTSRLLDEALRAETVPGLEPARRASVEQAVVAARAAATDKRCVKLPEAAANTSLTGAGSGTVGGGRAAWLVPAAIAVTLLIAAAGIGMWAAGRLGPGGSIGTPVAVVAVQEPVTEDASSTNNSLAVPSAANDEVMELEVREDGVAATREAGGTPRVEMLNGQDAYRADHRYGSSSGPADFSRPIVPGESSEYALPSSSPAMPAGDGQPAARPSVRFHDLPTQPAPAEPEPAQPDFDSLQSVIRQPVGGREEEETSRNARPAAPGLVPIAADPQGNTPPGGPRIIVEGEEESLLLRERSEPERLKQELAGKPKDNADVSKNPRSWRHDPLRPNTTRLLVGENDSLPLEGMQVSVVVDGFRARVLLDCYYLNNRGQQLEGSFQLRLPNEASLYYFAFGETAFEYRPMVDQLASRGFLPAEVLRSSGTGLDGIRAARNDSWTNVKEARVVPREQAAHAYSEVVRRRVDPALVEWSGAGVFEAKVYPLQPGKLHRVVIGYDVSLQQDGDDLLYSVPLPDISQCTVDLDVAAMPGASATVTPEVRPFVSGGRAFYHFDRPEGGAVSVRLHAPGNVLLTGRDERAGDFFATRFTPDLPAGQQQATSSHAVFLLDTSLSSRPERFNTWLSLLESVLRENRGSLDQFAVLLFDVECRWWQPGYTENTEENVERLLRDCRALALEGATDLRQALLEAAAPAWSDKDAGTSPDLFLLSDGATTWGEIDPQLLVRALKSGTAGPLFGYQTGQAGTESGVLELLARESGGAVFSVTSQDEVAAAATAHRQRPWQLVTATAAGGSDLLIAGRPRSIYPGQALLLVGRGVLAGDVVLQLRRGEQQHEARVAPQRSVESQLAPRVYGQVAVGQLEEMLAGTRQVSEAYARHFRVTGRSCSLLMLESEADYQRYNIRPEDDLFVVQSTPVDPLLVRKQDELAGQLENPKARLQQWLQRLERLPGVQWTLPAPLQLAIEQMPERAFDVRAPRLECQARLTADLPKEFVQWLAEAELNYGAISEEAERRLAEHGPADALRTVSNLVERSPGDTVLLQDVAFSAIRWGLPGQAYPLLQRVAQSRPYQPHVYTAIGQCLAETGHADLALVYYEVALNGQWHDRYRDVRQIAAIEYGHLLRRIMAGELNTSVPDYARARLESLEKSDDVRPADLVVVMMWNTDRTDVDLHVEEPSGDECYYKNPSTRSGGRISGDVTEGFGPEMYTIRSAPRGKYSVRANYYATDNNRTGVRTKVYVTVYQQYGSKSEAVSRHVVPLVGDKEKRDVVSVELAK
ncbi:MAG: VWA domain-containing protein [Pirellulaceae bacterium]|nr:VWA domain-containing protein [Pirellulaceae bacterium]